MYAIVAMPSDKPKILYLKHQQSASDGWIRNLLCDKFFEEHTEILTPIINNCKFQLSCKCKQCVRQPSSLRSLAAQAVFH